MTASETQSRLAAIGCQLERACALLLSPASGNMDRSAQILETASIDLAAIPAAAAAQVPEFALRLRLYIRRAAALLEHAAQFHQSWRLMQGAMCGGYQSGGNITAIETPARLSVEG